MLTHVFIHPGNPNLIELFALLAGFFLLLFTIDLALGFMKKKPGRKLHQDEHLPIDEETLSHFE